MTLKAEDPPIVVVQMISSTKELIWECITEVSHMREWFFAEIPAFKAEVGFETVFDVQSEATIFPHHWTVSEVIPYRKLVIGWCYEGFRGDGLVSFELIGHGSTTLVQLTFQIFEDFQSDVPQFTRESALEGWQYFINNRLLGYSESL